MPVGEQERKEEKERKNGKGAVDLGKNTSIRKQKVPSSLLLFCLIFFPRIFYTLALCKIMISLGL